MSDKLIDNPKNKSAIAIYESMPKNVDPDGAPADQWTTVAAIMVATTLAKSTVTGLLRKLEAERLAEQWTPDDKGAVKYWRSVVRDPAPVPVDEVAAQRRVRVRRMKPKLAAQEVAEAPADAEVAEATPEAVEPVSGGAVGSVAARMRQARPVADAPAEEVKATYTSKRSTCTYPGCGLPTLKVGRSWVHEFGDPDVGHKATTAKQRPPAAARGDKPLRAEGEPRRTLTIDPRWAGGGIKRAALDYLWTNNEEDFSVAEVAKAIGHTNTGAVGNALERLRLNNDGVALAQDKPRRYQAA